ncbi:MAG: YcxB family protein [Nitrospirota bacterium]|nr:YcxB family protein [Nitrospirota bacterium]
MAEISMEDFKAFRTYACSRGSKKSFFVNMLIWIPIGLVVTILANMKGIRLHLPTLVGGSALFIAMIFIYVYIARKRYVPASDGPVLGNKRFILTDDRFVEEGESSKSEVTIAAVKSLVETRDHFFVMVDKFAAYIVPKRSFRGVGDHELFRKYFAKAGVRTENL